MRKQGSETYRKFARYYDVYAGGFDADLPLYLSLCEPSDRILEVGCGTGRVLKALLHAGYHVAGIDTSPEMLRIAEDKLANYLSRGKLKLYCGSLGDVAFDVSFDRILVTWFTFNYLFEDRERRAFLNRALSTLGPNGLIAMDLFFPLPLLRPETENQWGEESFELEGRTVLLRQKRKMIGDVEERIQIYTEEGTTEEIPTRRRFATREQAVALLEDAGFTGVRIANGYDLSSWHVPGRTEGNKGTFVVTGRKL